MTAPRAPRASGPTGPTGIGGFPLDGVAALAADRALVALGANLGARRATLDGAVADLDATPGLAVLGRSTWHATPAEGGPPGQPDFLNGVVLLRSELEPEPLLARLQELERLAGRDRDREGPDGPRPLDLDLLLFGARTLASRTLDLPHPRMHLRTFVLAPLLELLPDLVLGTRGTVRQALASVRRAPFP